MVNNIFSRAIVVSASSHSVMVEAVVMDDKAPDDIWAAHRIRSTPWANIPAKDYYHAQRIADAINDVTRDTGGSPSTKKD